MRLPNGGRVKGEPGAGEGCLTRRATGLLLVSVRNAENEAILPFSGQVKAAGGKAETEKACQVTREGPGHPFGERDTLLSAGCGRDEAHLSSGVCEDWAILA